MTIFNKAQQAEYDRLKELATPQGFEYFEREFANRIHEACCFLDMGIISKSQFEELNEYWKQWLKAAAYQRVKECWDLWDSVRDSQGWDGVQSNEESAKTYEEIKKLKNVFEDMYYSLFTGSYKHKKRFAVREQMFVESVSNLIGGHK